MAEYVLTLMSSPHTRALSEEAVASIAAQFGAESVEWLEPGVACDIAWNHHDPLMQMPSQAPRQEENEDRLAAFAEQALASVLRVLGGLRLGMALPETSEPPLEPRAEDAPVPLEGLRGAAMRLAEEYGVDAIVQPVRWRKKKLLISDMDSTMITVECIDELADFVGKKAEVAAITDRAMNGELNFERALIERVALLEGLPEEVLDECYRSRVRMMAGAKELVGTMRHAGAHCVLVSGGFTFFTRRVAEELGFHAQHANTLEIIGGRLTGKVAPPILGKEAKLLTLIETCKTLGIAPEEALAVGDGANDLPMLLAAGLGVAYHAKPNVQMQARFRVNHGDLRALLWAQGYRAP